MNSVDKLKEALKDTIEELNSKIVDDELRMDYRRECIEERHKLEVLLLSLESSPYN